MMRFSEIPRPGKTAIVEVASSNGGERVDMGFFCLRGRGLPLGGPDLWSHGLTKRSCVKKIMVKPGGCVHLTYLANALLNNSERAFQNIHDQMMKIDKKGT
jgi:hypothetical protein